MYDQIYTVKFSDKTEFIGGDVSAPKWGKCPEKEISSLEILLPCKDKIILSEYEKYNFFIGAIRNLKDGKISVQHLFALGCNDNTVTSYRITLSSESGNKYRVGDMTVRNFPFGKEGIGRSSTNGWKKGIKK